MADTFSGTGIEVKACTSQGFLKCCVLRTYHALLDKCESCAHRERGRWCPHGRGYQSGRPLVWLLASSRTSRSPHNWQCELTGCPLHLDDLVPSFHSQLLRELCIPEILDQGRSRNAKQVLAGQVRYDWREF